MKNRRRLVLVPLAAAAVVLAFASVAYACTSIVGSITTTYNGNTCANTGTPRCQVTTGDTIESTGSNLNQPVPPYTRGSTSSEKWWGLYLLRHQSNQDSMNSCMSKEVIGEQKIGPSKQQGTSNSVTISGSIPASRGSLEPSGTGPALVCFISEFPVVGVPDYSYGTNPTELDLV